MNSTNLNCSFSGGSRSIRQYLPVLLLPLMAMVMSDLAWAAKSVSQYGITWSWNEDRQIGQYANGDWWVVGPVTITSITPASVTDADGWTRNGTMVNPGVGYGQGYDSSIVHLGAFYTGNVSPNVTGRPLVVATGSVVSTVSKSVSGASSIRPQLLVGAVLTVVSDAPPANSFRPPVTGTDKTSYWRESQMSYGILRSLAPVSSTPSLGTVENWFTRPWFVQMDNSPSRFISPQNNMPEYGRDQAHRVAEGMLSLHLNYTNAQKRNLFVRLVQYGIDIYGYVKAGGIFMDNGGLNVGRKAPMVLAAVALNDSDMLQYADAANEFVFHDDRQHWFVTQTDVGRELHTADGRPREEYRQEHVGLPEWGEKHHSNRTRDGSNWNAYYRHINGGPLAGQILAIRLTQGAEAAWNWPPVFAYIDRFWSIEGTNGYNGQSQGFPNRIGPFAFNMWTTYRQLAPGAPPTPPDSTPPAAPLGLRTDP